MTEGPIEKPLSLAAMPGVLVVLTLGYLGVMHLGHLWSQRERIEWTGRGVESAFLEAGATQVRGPVNRARVRLGLDANEVVMRGGELYYLPDIEHVMGRSVMEANRGTRHIVLRRDTDDSRSVDPLPAILDFDRQLRARGVRLVLMPTPSKAMFARSGADPMRNAGFGDFLAAMKAHDIPVFDPAAHFAKCAERGQRLFMKTDSHWTPEAMRLGAVFLAAFLEWEGLLPEGEEKRFHAGTTTVTTSGDLANLLDAGGGQRWQETAAVHPISVQSNRASDPVPWQSDPAAPLLLLGDSFLNVFSLPEMGWGEGGGFAETLSQSLGFSLDRIARNAEGAFASRRDLQQSPGRLEGKTVVVWQFAARELSFGDWKVLEVPAGKRASDAERTPDRIELEGTIAKVATIPPLVRTPYRQAVLEIHLREVRGAEGDLQAGVVLLGMGVEDRIPTALTRWKAGERRNVTVVPWSAVRERFGSLHRFALEDPESELLEVERFWIVE